MGLADIFAPLRDHKESIAKINADIEKVEGEAGELRAAPPDRDSLVAWALRAVDRAESDFADHLSSWYFKRDNICQIAGAWFDSSSGPRWLETQQVCPGIM